MNRHAFLGLAAILVAAAILTPKPAKAAESYRPFTGEKTTWHNGFDRYDFSMDDSTGAITPMTAPASEVKGYSIDTALRNGKRRCVVVVPKEPAPGCPKAGEEEFSRIMTEVVTEFGEHYKEKVAGYWFDCCYQAKEKCPGFSFREFFKACKAGNPDRILALNSWIYPNVSEWQEYWTSGRSVASSWRGTADRSSPGDGSGTGVATVAGFHPNVAAR